MQISASDQSRISSKEKNTPSDWEIIRLGDDKIIEKMRAGGTPLVSKKDYWVNGNIPFVKIEDITGSHKYLYKTKSKITKLGLDNSSAWLVPENSVLLSLYASFGEVIINKIPAATNQAIIALVLKKSIIDPQYLYYELNGSRNLWHKHIQENTQKNLNAEIARNFLIYLPPLNEQLKIASILSRVDELIQKTDQVIEQTQRLKKGLMQTLLTKGIRHTRFKETSIGKIPWDWDILEFGQVVEDIRYGTSVKCTTVQTGIPILRIPNIINGKIDSEDLKYAVLSDIDVQRYRLRDGDILFIRTNGNREYVGRCAVYHQNSDIHAFASYLIRVRLNVEKLNPDFLNIQFSLSSLRKQIVNNAKTSAGQYNINTNGIKSLKIVVPPLLLQQKIVSIIFHIEKLIQFNKDGKAKVEILKKGLMQKLLTGKIRVKA